MASACTAVPSSVTLHTGLLGPGTAHSLGTAFVVPFGKRRRQSSDRTLLLEASSWERMISMEVAMIIAIRFESVIAFLGSSVIALPNFLIPGAFIIGLH